MDLVDIAYEYQEISKISLGQLKSLRPTRAVARRAGAGALAATMLTGGGAAAIKAKPAIGRAVDEVRWNAHSNAYTGSGRNPGQVQLSKPDWIKAGRPGTGPGASFTTPPPSGSAKHPPMYFQGDKSGYWRNPTPGSPERGMQFDPFKDIRPGQLTDQQGKTWRF